MYLRMLGNKRVQHCQCSSARPCYCCNRHAYALDLKDVELLDKENRIRPQVGGERRSARFHVQAPGSYKNVRVCGESYENQKRRQRAECIAIDMTCAFTCMPELYCMQGPGHRGNGTPPRRGREPPRQYRLIHCRIRAQRPTLLRSLIRSCSSGSSMLLEYCGQECIAYLPRYFVVACGTILEETCQ